MKLHIDTERCVGCRVCEIICVATREKEFNPKRARIRVPITFPDPSAAEVCKQCDEAFCQQACVFEAISPNDAGVLTVDADKCTGCKACVAACPFKVMYVDVITDQAAKCDLCGGESECQKYCPTQAISVV